MELFLIVVEIVFFMPRQRTFWSYWGTYILGKAFGLTASIRMVSDFVVTRQSRALAGTQLSTLLKIMCKLVNLHNPHYSICFTISKI